MKKNLTRFLLLILFFISIQDSKVFAQSDADSTLRRIEEFMYRLRKNYQHEGWRLRFDTGLQVPVSRSIRVEPVKLYPGFGFSLGIGYGLTDHWSAYVGFSSLSHINDNFKTIDNKRVGFDGFHGTVKYKFQPYAHHQIFIESGAGIYEVVDQKSEGFTGWGTNLTIGFDQFLTNEVIISFGIDYRLTRFNAQVVGNEKYALVNSLEADMLSLKMTLTYNFPKDQSIFEL